jgi:hypothetical protein
MDEIVWKIASTGLCRFSNHDYLLLRNSPPRRFQDEIKNEVEIAFTQKYGLDPLPGFGDIFVND